MEDRDIDMSMKRERLSVLAMEVWRLSRNIEHYSRKTLSVSIRYSIRKMKEVLEAEGCLFSDFTGQTYDSGMALDVVDTEEDTSQKCGLITIKVMIAPVILWKGALLRHGQVILAKGTMNEKESERGVVHD